MNTYTFPLDPRYPDCTMVAYLQDDRFDRLDRSDRSEAPRPAILVCPGGAYQFLSDREAEPIALAYLHAGMQAFVLHYSVGDKARNDAPLVEVALAVRHLRERATEYNLDPARVFVIGFSAGGHLAAMSGVLWDHPVVRAAIGSPDEPATICKPTATLPCYPVISAYAPGWSQSFATLTGIQDYKNTPDADRYSLELHVDKETTAPSFIWHTFDDEGVDILHTLLYTQALARAGVPFEYHVYPHGPHGLSLATAETSGGNPAFERPNVAEWFAASVRYIESF